MFRFSHLLPSQPPTARMSDRQQGTPSKRKVSESSDLIAKRSNTGSPLVSLGGQPKNRQLAPAKTSVVQENENKAKLKELKQKFKEQQIATNKRIAELESALKTKTDREDLVNAKIWVEKLFEQENSRNQQILNAFGDHMNSKFDLLNAKFQYLEAKVDRLCEKTEKHINASCTMLHMLPQDFSRKRETDALRQELQEAIDKLAKLITEDKDWKMNQGIAILRLVVKVEKMEKFLISIGKQDDSETSPPEQLSDVTLDHIALLQQYFSQDPTIRMLTGSCQLAHPAIVPFPTPFLPGSNSLAGFLNNAQILSTSLQLPGRSLFFNPPLIPGIPAAISPPIAPAITPAISTEMMYQQLMLSKFIEPNPAQPSTSASTSDSVAIVRNRPVVLNGSTQHLLGIPRNTPRIAGISLTRNTGDIHNPITLI